MVRYLLILFCFGSVSAAAQLNRQQLLRPSGVISFHDTTYTVTDAVWTGKINVTETDGGVQKTSTTSFAWDAITNTVATFADGDLFQFQIAWGGSPAQMRIGFGTPTGTTAETQVAYGLYHFDQANKLIVQNGANSFNIPSFAWANNDYYRVQRIGTFINVYHSLNGTTWSTNPLSYESGSMTAASTYNLIVAFSTQGIAARNVKKFKRIIN